MSSLVSAPPPRSLSALSSYLSAQPAPPPPPPGANDTTRGDYQNYHQYHILAHQILHDLRYSHSWSGLSIHHDLQTSSPSSFPSSTRNTSTSSATPQHSTSRTSLPRPLISGLPPSRIYVHPDDQIDELRRAKQRQNPAAEADDDQEGGMGGREREWVLPTHLREKWSLKRLAEVFDAIPEVPPEPALDGNAETGTGTESGSTSAELASEGRGAGPVFDREREMTRRKRRGGKRLLLATLSDDSTVVYYIVHDGLVKPRQN